MTKSFNLPKRCTRESVNNALRAQDINLHIFEDNCNDWRFAVGSENLDGAGYSVTLVSSYDSPRTARGAALYIVANLSSLARKAAAYDIDIFRK